MYIFYIITGLMIFLYIFQEKKVVAFIDKIAEMISEYIQLPINLNFNILINTLLILTLSIICIYIFKIDFTYSTLMPFKNKAMMIIIFLNICLILLVNFKKNYLSMLFILNLAFLIFAKAMLGVDDQQLFNLLMIVDILLAVIIYLMKDLSKSLKTILNGIYLIFLVVVIQNFYLGNYYIPTGSMEKTIMVGDRIFANNIIYHFKKPQVGDIIAFKEPLDDSLMYTKRITGAPGDIFKINDVDNHIYLNNEKSKLNREYSVEGILRLFNNPQIYIPKKGDMVKLAYLIEFDIDNKEEPVRIISLEEFKSLNIDKELYKYIFGIWNSKTLDQISGIKQDLKNKRYTYILTDENNNFILPILDFKYDDNINKLLNNEYIKLKDNYYMAMGDNTRNSNDSRFFGYVKEKRIYGKLLLRWLPLNRFGLLKDE